MKYIDNIVKKVDTKENKQRKYLGGFFYVRSINEQGMGFIWNGFPRGRRI